MRCPFLAGLTTMAFAGIAGGEGIILDGQFRLLEESARLEQWGSLIEYSIARRLSIDSGPFVESLGVGVHGPGPEYAVADAWQSSFIGTESLTGSGMLSASASTVTESSEAEAWAFNIFVADFLVTEPTWVEMSGSIGWAGAPDLMVLKLRRNGHTDLFELEGSGDEGSLWGSERFLLTPSWWYQVTAIAVGHTIADLPGAYDDVAASYSFSMRVIPGSPTSPALLLGALTCLGVRRRSGATA